MMNRSSVRRLVESTKTRIKAANTPRENILSEIEYRKLLHHVDEFDSLLAALLDLGKEAIEPMGEDVDLIASIKHRRQSLAPILHRLISDSAHANREGRAINRWSYKKKLHAVSKGLVDGVQADIVQLRSVHELVVR